MRTKIVALALCIAFATVPNSAVAQEMKAERETNVTYHRVEMVKFHYANRPCAAELVDNISHPRSGKWAGR